jgi:hypothetical protein
MRRFSFFASLAPVLTFALAPVARGQYQPPAGYYEIPLVDSMGNPLTPGGLAVSPSGELAVTNGDTVTLYNTWQNGRVQIGQVTNSSWVFDTDPVFLNNSTILFGENYNTDALWSATFNTVTGGGTSAEVTPNGSLTSVEGVTVLDSNHALVSGDDGGPASLYLDSVNLTTGGISPVVQNFGSGYPGNPAVTPGGNYVLLEASASGDESYAHVISPTGADINDIPLDGSEDQDSAYGIAFDSAGNAYITTTDVNTYVTAITEVSGIDSANPVVSQFGIDSDTDYLTSISFTGGAFNAGQAGDTGALIVNDSFGNGAFAIVVPEPASLGLLGFAGFILTSRRRGSSR